MQPAPTDAPTEPRGARSAAARFVHRLAGVGPLIGLILLCVLGTLLNRDFATAGNLLNVLTRTSFIGIISVGMTFVIISGGIDLSVGSMAALIAGVMIWVMNTLAASEHAIAPLAIVAIGMAIALVLGAVFGLAHGLLITRGRIEPFIVTLGTLGIFRSVLTWLADGGALTLQNNLVDLYGPVYYASLFGIPVPVWVFAFTAAGGALILNRTAFGRHVQAIGSNEQVARYAAIRVDRVKCATYVLLGVCVGV
ncbi:MAG TPA: ABC transporter permease, partial [Paraburkholderia sp.]|nr:ABC transporter permease [Paraburkholderia sp.]